MSAREHRAVTVTGLIAGFAIAATLSSCSSSTPPSTDDVLKIGAIPDQNPEKLNRLYGSLSAELNAALEVPVKYIPVSNYAAAVSAFRTGSLDVVWFGGLTGVQCWPSAILMPSSQVCSLPTAPAGCDRSPVPTNWFN